MKVENNSLFFVQNTYNVNNVNLKEHNKVKKKSMSWLNGIKTSYLWGKFDFSCHVVTPLIHWFLWRTRTLDTDALQIVRGSTICYLNLAKLTPSLPLNYSNKSLFLYLDLESNKLQLSCESSLFKIWNASQKLLITSK